MFCDMGGQINMLRLHLYETVVLHESHYCHSGTYIDYGLPGKYYTSSLFLVYGNWTNLPFTSMT